MKKTFIILSMFLISGLIMIGGYKTCADGSNSYFAADFMSTKEAEKKWGIKRLDLEAFKSKDFSERAPMAVDIIKRQLYVSKRQTLVRTDLGPPDSYFFSDTIYAYKIMPFPGRNKEYWHLVFIPDDKLENVKEVKIHKKCCYNSPLKDWIK